MITSRDPHVRLVFGVMLAACDSSNVDRPEYCGNGALDINEECDGEDTPDCAGCRLRSFDVTVRWSFESQMTGVTSSCVRGDPPVVIHTQSIHTGRNHRSVPCAGGSATVPIKLGSTAWLTSTQDGIEYTVLFLAG